VKATEVTAGLAESNGSLLPGLWRDSLHVTCGLTACTSGSAPCPTLGNEYGKTLPFIFFAYCLCDDWVCSTIKQELGELEKVETQKNRMTELHDELQTIHSEEKQEHVSLTPFEQCIFNAGRIIMHSLVSVCLPVCTMCFCNIIVIHAVAADIDAVLIKKNPCGNPGKLLAWVLCGYFAAAKPKLGLDFSYVNMDVASIIFSLSV